MKIKLNLTLLVVALGSMLCMSTYAQTAKSFPVVVPENQASYHVGITGLYVTPTNDDLYYAVTGSGDEANSSRCARTVDLDNQWGWRLDAGYNFACSGNDISINWTRVCGDDDCTTSGSHVRDRFIRRVNFNRVKGDAEFNLDEVNLELGQKVDFCSLHTRFHFGLSYANLCHDFDTNASGRARVRNNASLTGRSKLESEFWGFGPRFGFDAAYPLGGPCSPVAVVGHVAGAFLAGEICVDSKSSVTRTIPQQGDTPASTTVTNFSSKSDDVCTVIPTGTFKLGLKYSSNPDPAGCGWGAELGYQATGYYHVVHHDTVRAGPATQISNFGYYGCYLTLNYAG